MDVRYHPEAETELDGLPTAERLAMLAVTEKLKVLGDQLPYPHSSNVRGADKLRELRPRAGRSAWRAFYRRISSTMVIAAIGPEAQANPRGFSRAVKKAEERLGEIEGAQ